jgi:hypothetical protein
MALCMQLQLAGWAAAIIGDIADTVQPPEQVHSRQPRTRTRIAS